jgi:IS5 family transposase
MGASRRCRHAGAVEMREIFSVRFRRSGQLSGGLEPKATRGISLPWKTAAEHVEYLKAAVRAKVKHPFRVIKRQFGFQKVRFKGLAKNTAQVMTLFALSNLWMARRTLLASSGEIRL